jgi:hypothetical protein
MMRSGALKRLKEELAWLTGKRRDMPLKPHEERSARPTDIVQACLTERIRLRHPRVVATLPISLPNFA